MEHSMKFITVRDIRTSPAEIWKQLPDEQEMVITNNGRPIALLTPLSDETLEETLSAVRRARAVNAVHQMRRLARERGLDEMSEEDIQAEIDAARRERSK
jgi:antitoxin (DNA-binding transcriptional repressor) of toxin-antitoxin stability system